MASFEQEIMPLLEAEGGLNTNKADRGGLTKFGISQKSYPNLNIESLTPEKAAEIYKRDYWDKIGGDKLAPATAAVAFDAAVNHGVGKAKALLAYSGGNPEKMLSKRKQLYDNIAKNDPTQAQFHQGWMNRLENLGSRIASMVNPIGTAYADETPWQEPIDESLYLQKAQELGFIQPEQPAQPEEIDEAAYLAKAQELGFLESEQPEPSLSDNIKSGLGNLAAGGLKGASEIGNSLLSAGQKYNDLLGNKYAISNQLGTDAERRIGVTEGLQSLGANPDSGLYKAGKIGAEIAGTAGVGGALGKAAASIPKLAGLAEPLASGGLKGGDVLTKLLSGAAAGGVSTTMVNPDDAITGGVLGAVLPIGVGGLAKTGNALSKAIGGNVSPEVKALAAKAKDMGITIPADRLVDSKPLNALSSALNYVPFSGRAAVEDNMGKQLNQAVSKLVGQNSPNMTKALRDASVDLGAKFDDVLKNNAVKVDDDFLTRLGDIEQMASRTLGKSGETVIGRQIDEIMNKTQSGIIDGEAAYNIKRELDLISQGNGTEAHVATELKKSLMEALSRSLGKEKAAAFATTRKQYSNMLALERLAKNEAEGDISVARLANMKNIGNQDLQDIADVAAQFVKPREGQHGAMQRAVAGGVGAYAAGLPGLAGAAIGGRGLNTLLNSDLARNMVLKQKGNGAIGKALARSLVKSVPVMSQSEAR
jgi:Glycosyl hydrolase 108